MEKAQTTYLFGAGASIGSVPVQEDLANSLLFLDTRIKNVCEQKPYESYPDQGPVQAIGNLRPQLFRDLDLLCEETKKHETVDTYARKLFIRRELDELMLLKIRLSAYFLIRQVLYGIDRRYDTFFLTIGEPDPPFLRLPQNINFVSWNYDSQIELALAAITSQKTHRFLANLLDIQPWPENFLKSERPHLIKLNGTANLFRQDRTSQHFSDHIFLSPQDSAFLSVWKTYDEMLQEGPPFESIPLVNYAWEIEEPAVNSARQKALELFSNTTSLIVIGYSFPVFNRAVDRQLIAKLPKHSTIYVQNATTATDAVIRRIKALAGEKKLRFEAIHDLKQFFVPSEAW